MPQVKYKSLTEEEALKQGGVFNVGDTKPWLESGKYEIYEPQLATKGGGLSGTQQDTGGLTISTNKPELNKGLSKSAEIEKEIVGLTQPDWGMKKESIAAEEVKRKSLQEQQIEAQFQEQVRKNEEARQAGLGQMTGARATQGQAMGFSSAEVGILNMVNKRFDERTSELNRAKEEAKRNLDIDSLNRIQTQLDAEQKKYDTKMDVLWDRFFKTKALEAGEEGLGFEKEKFATNIRLEEEKLKASLEEESKKPVRELMTKYPDAGITEIDDAETIKQKLANSEIYKKTIADEYKTITETGDGRNWLVTYDPQGKLVRKVDLGSAYKGTGGGGGGSVSSGNFTLVESEAQKEIDNILSGQSNWSASWNRLKQFADKNKIPLSNEEINILLGGEIPYNPQTGQYETEKAKGLASEEQVKKQQQAKFKQTQTTSHGTVAKETDKYRQYSDGFIEYK